MEPLVLVGEHQDGPAVTSVWIDCVKQEVYMNTRNSIVNGQIMLTNDGPEIVAGLLTLAYERVEQVSEAYRQAQLQLTNLANAAEADIRMILDA